MAGRAVMSWLFIALFTVACHGATPADDEIAWRPNLAEATQELLKGERPMLLLLTTSACSYCTLMKQTTYTDTEIVSEVNQFFVPMRLDGGQAREIARRLGVRLYPTTVVISPQNRVVARWDGYVKPDALLPKLAALRPERAAAVATPAKR